MRQMQLNRTIYACDNKQTYVPIYSYQYYRLQVELCTANFQMKLCDSLYKLHGGIL